MKTIQEDEDIDVFARVMIVLVLLVSLMFIFQMNDIHNERISAHEKNLTELQDWIRASSENITHKIQIECSVPTFIKTNFEIPKFDKIECYREINEHFLKGTNISTDRFFR